MTVRASLGQLFMRNWPIKLAALFFAVMLYVAVHAPQPLSQSFAMRLAIATPPGRTVRQQPAGVTVVIAGTGSEILKLRSFPRVIRKVIPDTFSTSLWRIQLQAADVELPKGIDVPVADIRPRDIELLLDSVAHTDVRIVPRVKVDAESGYVPRGLSTTPSLARPPRGARRTRLRVPQAEGRAWLTSFWESRHPATKRRPPSSWASADAPSSPASSSSRRTCTRCSVAWCRSSPAGRTCPPCRRWWTARSPRRDSPGAPWTRWR